MDSRQQAWQGSQGSALNSRANPMDSGRYQSGPMLQSNPYLQPGQVPGSQYGHGVQQGGYPPEQLTAVPAGDGSTVVNAPDGRQGPHQNLFSAQGRQSPDWHRTDPNAALRTHGGPNGTLQNGTAHSLRSVHGSYEPLDAYEQYLGGMEGHTRLLRLMHDAFSNAPKDGTGEVNTLAKQGGGLNKLGFLGEIYKVCGFSSERSPEELEKLGVDNELKLLYKKRKCAEELMDEVENHILQIEQVMHDRKRHRERVLASIGVKAGIIGQCCSCGDDENAEYGIDGREAGQVMLRGHLKQRLEEVQVELSERTQEVNQLKQRFGVAQHEMNMMGMQGNMAGMGSSQVVGVKEMRARLVRHYAAQFSRSEKQFEEMAFLAWKTWIKTQTAKDKGMKKGALALSLITQNGVVNIAFSSWKTLMTDQRNKAHKRQDRMMHYYAAKFTKSDASAELCFREWSMYVRDSRAQDRMLDAETRIHRDVGDQMEARYGRLSQLAAQGHLVSAKVSIASAMGLGTQQHTVYVVCEIPGRPKASFHTEAVKTTGQGTGPSGHGPLAQAVTWNHMHMVSDFAAGDEFVFKVMIKGGIMHTLHLGHDECIGTGTLKASQFFPHGYEGTVRLLKDKIVRGEPESELKVRVEINMEKILQQGSARGAIAAGPGGEVQDHAQNAAQAAARAHEAAAAAEKALKELRAQSPPPKKSSHCVVS